jgi:hypothetical protein
MRRGALGLLVLEAEVKAARSEPEVFAGRGRAKRACGEMTSGEEARFYLTALWSEEFGSG